jgi:hypothetical protein
MLTPDKGRQNGDGGLSVHIKVRRPLKVNNVAIDAVGESPNKARQQSSQLYIENIDDVASNPVELSILMQLIGDSVKLGSVNRAKPRPEIVIFSLMTVPSGNEHLRDSPG